VDLLVALLLLALVVVAVGVLWIVAHVPDQLCCWRCGKELAYEDEWHLDVTRLPGKVLCGRCWERIGG
jgi:hypothetical protein